MKKIGIVCEYNPFHLGHLYQINKIKQLYPDSLIIVIFPTTFTQRGEVSIISKWNKTSIALANKVDLVLELPFVFATQSADIFAKGALEILNKMQIDTLVFGSESDDVTTLIELAKCQLYNKYYNLLVKDYLDQGLNYPTALSQALQKLTAKKIDQPNDLLALAYIKEIIKNDYPIVPISIKRTNDYHSQEIDSSIISASLIRKLYFEDQEISDFVPLGIDKYLEKVNNDNFWELLKYQIINNKNNLARFQTVDEGIENRIIKYIDEVNSWHELVTKIKTKRYTYNKINRMLIHILTNFTKEEATDLKIDYLRVLGFSDKGKEHLNQIKKEINCPLITNYKKNISKILDIEFRVNEIYALKVNKDLIKEEYQHKPIIKNC